ncbi:MAG TPA: outer membrane lipoprotein-sorting protein [Candidatus Acidoferrum sp.]|jgi:hypothetical protein|nr:outer membrane lipoprotein-sorting protein [Candidatus Acidoferrum sp.]
MSLTASLLQLRHQGRPLSCANFLCSIFKARVSVLFFLLSLRLCAAQPKSELAPPPPLSPAEGEREARSLLTNLLSQKPDQNSTNTGVLKVRDADRHERTVPVKFEVLLRPDRWLNTYEATPADNVPGQKLTITHQDGRANEYLLTPIGATNSADSAPRTLTGNELMTPFAGSDFWAVDLGLEFLYWPQQRVLKKQMRKNLFCDVLQSTNPCPAPGAYSRVLSWIAVNRPDEIVVVHAEAYDFQGKLLKEFDPKKVQKVNGVWQLEEMEIRNRQTGSRTRIEFNLDSQ